MSWLKNNPLFGTMLLLAVVSLVAETWLLLRERQQAQRAVAELEQNKQDRAWLARQSPAPSEKNEQAIGRDLAGAERTLMVLQTVLQGQEAQILTAPVPSKSIDAFFDVAAFVEKTRGLATRAQVMTRPDERFGFGSHTNEGPEPGQVPTVFRQRIIAQYLVEALLEAHPQALLALQREYPLTAAQRAARNQPVKPGPAGARPADDGGHRGDFFDFDEQLSLRVPGEVECEAFRLVFTGQTQTVRTFLNSLASFKLPIVVRSVEAEPLSIDAPVVDSKLPLVTGAPVPLVAQNLSRFTVVVEFVEFASASGRFTP